VTSDEAQRLVAAHLKHPGGPLAGLNPQGVAGALVAGEQLLFEYVTDSGTLRTSAFVYRWREWPAPGLLEALQQEAMLGETGGGALEYAPERKTLSLVREYAARPPESRFEQEQADLRQACARWREVRFAEIAERVRHPGAGPGRPTR
jgi:hypothetical protein